MNIFKHTEGIFHIFCQSQDMADFHILQGKLEPVTLNRAVAWQIFCTSFCDTIWPTFEYCERTVETSCSVGKFFLLPKRSFQVDENFEYNNAFLLCLLSQCNHPV